MERHPNDLTSDEQIDRAIGAAAQLTTEPQIVDAVYRGEPGLDFLMLTLSTGQRLLIPREDLPELRNATPEQAAHFIIGPHRVDLWWPQLDDGLYLPDFLKYRWHKQAESLAA